MQYTEWEVKEREKTRNMHFEKSSVEIAPIFINFFISEGCKLRKKTNDNNNSYLVVVSPELPCGGPNVSSPPKPHSRSRSALPTSCNLRANAAA